MSTTTNLGITKLEVGQAQKEATINAALDALDAQIGGAWTSWTPTWTNLSVGNGTVVAKYAKNGKLVHARVSLVFGSTTSVSGDIQFTLPVTAATDSTTLKLPFGPSRGWDASATTVYTGAVAYVDTTHAGIRFALASGTYVTQAVASSTVPFTWTTSDEISGQFIYEAA